jgi:phage-related protein (TIGR01555 family)
MAAASSRISGRKGGLVVADGLTNAISGAGGANDKRAYDRYSFCVPVTQAEVEAAYRTSWLARKIHDLPPWDMTREWRDWQATKEQITAIEAEEKRLGLRAKVRKALTWARLYGGAALILGLGDADPSQPVSTVAKGGLRYVHVMTRYQVTIPEIDTDPASDFFGQPVRYDLNGKSGPVALHPSRVIPFIGQPIPEGLMGVTSQDAFWGDPLLMSVRDAIINADLSQNEVAGLLHEAKVDTIGIPDLMALVATAEYEARLVRRINVAELAKSRLNTRLYDANETWETRQINFSGLPEVVTTFLQLVAAAADIPVTRLLGTSAKGLNATGEGDNDNYDEMVSARQETDLRPILERLDAFLLPSAAVDPSKAFFAFAPLDKPTPKEEAELQDKKADTAKKYVDSGLVPRVALATAVQNALIEDNVYPGLEQALKDTSASVGLPVEEFKAIVAAWQSGGLPKVVIHERLRAAGLLPKDLQDFDAFEEAIQEEGPALGTMSDPVTGKPVDPNAPQPGRQAAADASPRTLYVSRPVANADEIRAWAKAQGFKLVQPAEALHVTIAFSRTPLDWMKIGDPWSGDTKGELVIAPGGARLVEPLGPKGAIVLLFNSSELAWRHMQIKEAGASWDWPEYQPHITITYDQQGVDLAKVEPYRGRIVLGPERFEEITDGWSATVVEDARVV